LSILKNIFMCIVYVDPLTNIWYHDFSSFFQDLKKKISKNKTTACGNKILIIEHHMICLNVCVHIHMFAYLDEIQSWKINKKWVMAIEVSLLISSFSSKQTLNNLMIYHITNTMRYQKWDLNVYIGDDISFEFGLSSKVISVVASCSTNLSSIVPSVW
jgi:hypothetical protein